jgi:hypothetical protein
MGPLEILEGQIRYTFDRGRRALVHNYLPKLADWQCIKKEERTAGCQLTVTYRRNFDLSVKSGQQALYAGPGSDTHIPSIRQLF